MKTLTTEAPHAPLRARIVETLVYYDEPLVVSARGSHDEHLLAVAVPDDSCDQRWLAAQVEPEIEEAFRNGGIDLRELLLEHRTGPFLIADFGVEGEEVEFVEYDAEVTEDWLPEPGFFLPL